MPISRSGTHHELVPLSPHPHQSVRESLSYYLGQSRSRVVAAVAIAAADTTTDTTPFQGEVPQQREGDRFALPDPEFMKVLKQIEQQDSTFASLAAISEARHNNQLKDQEA